MNTTDKTLGELNSTLHQRKLTLKNGVVVLTYEGLSITLNHRVSIKKAFLLNIANEVYFFLPEVEIIEVATLHELNSLSLINHALDAATCIVNGMSELFKPRYSSKEEYARAFKDETFRNIIPLGRSVIDFASYSLINANTDYNGLTPVF